MKAFLICAVTAFLSKRRPSYSPAGSHWAELKEKPNAVE
jgi:hypothetical protein